MEQIQFADIINIKDLQRMQDLFSDATGVASIITTPEGIPITKPSNFCALCSDVIRKTEKGLANCMLSDSELGKQNLNGPKIQLCLSGGLWDAGVSINADGIHIANWLIGQVQNEAQDIDSMLDYAHRIGANHDEFLNALKKVPVMSKEQFKKVANMLYAFVNEFSDKAHSNYLLKQTIELNKKKEEELIQEKNLMQALMDNIPDQIYFKDLESRFIRSSKAHADSFHLENPIDTIGKTDFDFFSEEHASEAFHDEQTIIEQGITISKEEKETWPDRPNTWVSTTKAPLRDQQGSVIGTFGISRDITLRKRAEELLKQSEERFRTIIENLGEGVGIVNENEEFVFTNPIADEIFGVEKGGLIGRNLKEFMSEEHYKEIEYQTKIHKLGEHSKYENEILRLNGERRLILVSSVPKFDKEGHFEGTYGVFRDITQRKKDELIIQNQNLELKEINSQKDKLFSIIAHDLRSPFNSFLGLTELMEKELHLMTLGEIQTIAHNMKESATRIYNLLSNLLEWTRMQRGMIVVTPQHFLLNDVTQQCTEALMEIALAKSIEFENKVPDDFEVYADPNMLQITIHNLLTNALKFTPKQGKVSIRVNQLNADEVEISISDTGIGMSKEMAENLFRIDVNSNRPGTNGEPSTGLGLLLCKEFIEKHRGKIWVTSEEGKGSTFRFTLPLQS
jgi:PAS domain S-box-containing protein